MIYNCALHLQLKADKYLDKRRAVSQVEYHLGHMEGRRRHLGNLFERWNSGFQVEDDYQTFVNGAKEVWQCYSFHYMHCSSCKCSDFSSYSGMFGYRWNLPHNWPPCQTNITILRSWYPSHTVDHLVIQFTTLSYSLQPCNAVDHLVIQLTTLSYSWPPCHTVDYLAIQLTTLSCSWPPCHAAGQLVIQLVTLSCSWPPCNTVVGHHVTQLATLLHADLTSGS